MTETPHYSGPAGALGRVGSCCAEASGADSERHHQCSKTELRGPERHDKGSHEATLGALWWHRSNNDGQW